MEYNKLIAEFENGNEIEGFYVLKDAVLKTTMAGKPFLSGLISDRSGTMELKVWDYAGPIGTADTGKVIKLRGDVSEFKGSLQLVAALIRLAQENDAYDTAALVPVAPIDAEKTIQEIRAQIHALPDADYRLIAETLLERHQAQFLRIPAAKSLHHSFLSGLLMHTANMMKIAAFLADLYNDLLDRSLLLTGVLLHDFAKESEFVFSELGMVTDYSVKGNLLGHLVLGAQEVADFCKEQSLPEEKSLLLQHLILSHHGDPEYGAAVRPICAEAELLSYIDRIDSRMEIYTEQLADVPVGGFSGRIYALDKKIYHHG